MLLTIREMQINATVQYLCTHIRMAKSKMLRILSASEDVEQQELLLHC